MASEWNRALRTAQRVIKQRAETLPGHEGANRDMVQHSQVAGLKAAGTLIAALIEPEES